MWLTDHGSMNVNEIIISFSRIPVSFFCHLKAYFVLTLLKSVEEISYQVVIKVTEGCVYSYGELKRRVSITLQLAITFLYVFSEFRNSLFQAPIFFLLTSFSRFHVSCKGFTCTVTDSQEMLC